MGKNLINGQDEEEEIILDPEDDNEDVTDGKKDDVDEGKPDKDGNKTYELDDVDEDAPEPKIEKKDQKQSKENKAFAAMRAENARLKKLVEESERKRTPAPSYQPPPSRDTAGEVKYFQGKPIPQTDQEWDELGKRDWKLAVDMRSHVNSMEVVGSIETQRRDNDELMKSKQKVMARHPELSDPNSEKSRIFLQILNENPRYKNDPRGPVHTMRDMEERMVEMGYKPEEIIKAETRGVQTERERQNRVNLTTSTGKTVEKNDDKKVVLSSDELEFCKYNNINPKDYAEQRYKLSKKGAL